MKYETKIASINGDNRPSMNQIVNAADRTTNAKANYSGSIKDMNVFKKA